MTTAYLVATLATSAAWVAVAGLVLRRTRPRTRPEQTVSAAATVDPSTVRVLRAVDREGAGDALPRALVAAAVAGLVDRRLVTVERQTAERRLRPEPGAARATGLAGYERLLLDRIVSRATLGGGSVPLAALGPSHDVGSGSWVDELVPAALDRVTGRGLVRERVRPGLRRALAAARLVPVGCLAVTLVLWLEGSSGVLAALATIAFVVAPVQSWSMLGEMLAPMRGLVPTERGRAALAAAPGPAAAPLSDFELPVAPAAGGTRWSPASGTWRTVELGPHAAAHGGAEPYEVTGMVVGRGPGAKGIALDDGLGRRATGHRLTPQQLRRASYGSWVTLLVVPGRKEAAALEPAQPPRGQPAPDRQASQAPAEPTPPPAPWPPG